MKLAIRNLLKGGLLLGLVSVGAYACGQSNGGGSGSGGSSAGGSGGTSSGGHSGSGGYTSTGGTTTSGGTTGSGGAHETGGTVGSGGSNSGGTKATGGSASGGAATGGSSSGGAGGSSSSTAMGGTGGVLTEGTGGKVTGTGGAAPGTGGKGGTSGPTDGGPAAGGAGGASSGACQKGQIKPAEVVIMGESFYAIAPQYIETRIESDAQTAGALASGAKYRNVAVSGQNMNYIATTEWTNATSGGASVKNVIMDGGGIDCLTGGGSAGCTTCPDTFKTLLGKMVTAGVEDVIYTRYPEPGSPPGSNASLKACLDATMPNMQTVCQGISGLRCHWVDLRPVWQTNDVLSDGLHPTQSGGDHVGDLIWSTMVSDCMAQ